jgi:hypothetical protein
MPLALCTMLVVRDWSVLRAEAAFRGEPAVQGQKIGAHEPWRPVLKVVLPRRLPSGMTDFDPSRPPTVQRSDNLQTGPAHHILRV